MKNIDYMVSRVSNMAKSDETPASNRAGESAEALTGNSTVGAPLIQHTSATSSSTAVRPAVSTEGTSKDPSQRSLLHDEWDADVSYYYSLIVCCLTILIVYNNVLHFTG